MIYDIFYISKSRIHDSDWSKFRQRFPISQKIENVKNFEDVRSRAFTKFFYVVWDGTEVLDFNFDYKVSEWDEQYIHVWKTLRNQEETYQGGIALFPKHVTLVSSREFANKFYLNKKEIEQITSRQVYPKYSFKNYEEYKTVLETTGHDMFWYVPDDIEIVNADIFNLYFDANNGKYDYDRNENHVFKNENYFDGVVLFSKNKPVSEKEFKFRFFITKKEWDVIVSVPKKYDIFFISYNEPTADENYQLISNRFSKVKRIHGIKGIYNAHLEAANRAETDMFWVVDADAIIEKDFTFEIEYYPHYDSGNRREHLSTVHVWQSRNPINGLIYGYGGVKLLPKYLVKQMNNSSIDITTSISNKLKVVSKVSNITAFNVSPFETWKSAFRECVKLSSKIIDRNYDEENEQRLRVWMTEGKDSKFGEYAIAGAKEGYRYGNTYLGDVDALSKINDFEWIHDQFIKWQKNNEQSTKDHNP